MNDRSEILKKSITNTLREIRATQRALGVPSTPDDLDEAWDIIDSIEEKLAPRAMQEQAISPPGMCQTCDGDPCVNPSFCRACRTADKLRAAGKPMRFPEPANGGK